MSKLAFRDAILQVDFPVLNDVWRSRPETCAHFNPFFLLHCLLAESWQVQHAKRTQALGRLTAYQPELIRAVISEVRDLDKDVSNILTPFNGSFTPSADPAAACSLLVDHLCMRRNKRCLLAYHRVRTDKVEEMCWSGYDVSMQSQARTEVDPGDGNGISSNSEGSNLSPEEKDYMRQYGDLLAGLSGQWTDVDLTGSLVPPRDLFIDVRVLKNAGEIQTEYG